MTRQRVIVCEGYDDRDFLAGLLERVGGREQRTDPWAQRVQGSYGYTIGSAFVRLAWAKGDQKLLPASDFFVREHATKPLEHLVLCRDSDSLAPDTRGQAQASLDGWIAKQPTADFQIHPLIWWCDDPPDLPGVPNQQTLERLVCAALRQVHPDRADDVQRWLDREPTPSVVTHKNHRLAHLAKWYADRGTAHFWRAVWQEAPVAAALEQRLRATGAWTAIEAVTSTAEPG